jgi:3-phosphoshikimate 1-carboxyvinyltransferase
MSRVTKQKVNITSQSENLVAQIQLPASKSISNRALILNEILKVKLGKGIVLLNVSDADDTQILITAIAQSGGTIYLDNAGTCMRFLCAYFAALPGINVVLTGSERLHERPIHSLVKALQKMGAEINYLSKENCLPISIVGKQLSGGLVKVTGNQSSQFISALLLIAPLLTNPLEIQVEGEIVSKEYIKLSQLMLQEFGIPCQISEDYRLIKAYSIHQENIPETYNIEADWSSAAFFYEAAILAEKADLFFENLQLNSIQGDAILAKWMEEFGINSIQKENGVAISKIRKGKLNINKIDFTNHPDLASAIICASAGASIPFCAEGISSLQVKESNRIIALKNGLDLLHFKVKTTENTLCHDGLAHAFYQNSCINTENDHRITMAFSMLAIAQSNIVLLESESVKKSFPNFWIEAKKIGLTVK